MAIHPDFPKSPHEIIKPKIRWFPADEILRESTLEKLLPPLVPELRRQVARWRDSGYEGVSETSQTLLNWWFKTDHPIVHADIQVAQHEGRRLESIRKIESGHSELEALLRIPREEHDVLRVPVGGVCTQEDVPLLRACRHTRRRACALHVEEDARHFSVVGETDELTHE